MGNATLHDVQLSGFKHAFQSAPTGTFPLAQVLDDIRIGRHQSAVQSVRKIFAARGKRAYDEAKAKLLAVTFAGVFLPSRGIANLRQHSGVVHGDIDHLPDVSAIKQAICRDPRTVYCFISPSETGLKLGVHVPIVTDDPAYKYAWQVVSTAYESMYGAPWDHSGKDISRLCFVSDDPQAYINLQADVFDVPPMPTHEPRHPIPRCTSVPRVYHERHLDYTERAIRTAVDMIQSAPMGTRHHTRLKAARLLGGYVAGGLLSDEAAYGALAQALIGFTEDLQRSMKTIEDGLAYGQAHPITIEALEAERQAWLEAHQPDDPTADNNPWGGTRTLPMKPYRGLRLRKWVRHG